MGKETTTSGSTMVAPSFLNVSAKGTFTLGDIQVTGYADAVWDEEEEQPVEGTGVAGGDFVVVVLNQQGSAESKYYWIDDGNGHKDWYHYHPIGMCA